MKWNRLEISIPYSYNVSGDMGIIRLIGGTITSCDFLIIQRAGVMIRISCFKCEGRICWYL